MSAVENAAYLTVDDGPAGDFMEKVEYLNVKGIRAIWFCAGEALERFEKEAAYAIKTGHVIGNRGYDDADFSQITINGVREQLERTDRIIDELYAGAGAERPAKVFRFPYVHDLANEEHFTAIQQALDLLGYRQPAFENIRPVDSGEATLKPGIHVSCTLDTFDIGTDDLQVSMGNEIIKIHDWIAADSFKALVDKLLANGAAFKLPKEMSLMMESV